MELDTTPDADGTPFALRVNGKPVLVKGANWIPDDCFPHRVDRARYATRVADATDAGVNLLRVWGGGLFESDDFYDVCDDDRRPGLAGLPLRLRRLRGGGATA